MHSFRIILATICMTFLVADPIKDRFIVRKGNSIELKCNLKNNSENIKWNFISFKTNTSGVIYENQIKGSLKDGFESLCFQPHCNIKLTKARIEDSGTYFCSSAQNEERDTYIKIYPMIELIVRGPTYEKRIVDIDKSVVLRCNHRIENISRIRWDHISTDGIRTMELYYMLFGETSDSNYEARCTPRQLSCDLKVHRSSKKSAGRYICLIGDSSENEKTYGYNDMTDFIEIDVVVHEGLSCNENMGRNLVLLGENDCHGLEPDVLRLKCSLVYYGDLGVAQFQLGWRELSGSDMKNLTSTESIVSSNGGFIVTIQTNLSVELKMSDSKFECFDFNGDLKPCQLQNFTTQYIKNSTGPQIPNHEDLKCSASKSENIQCSYDWFREDIIFKKDSVILSSELTNLNGIYTCYAKCSLSENRKCTIKAIEFIVVESKTMLIAVFIVIGIILVLALALILLRFYLRIKHKNKKSENKEVPLMEQQENVPVHKSVSGFELSRTTNLHDRNIDEKSRVCSFAMSQDEFCVISTLPPKVHVYYNCNFTLKPPVCKLKMDNIINSELINNRLYILGRELDKLIYFYVIRKINMLSDESEKIYKCVHDKNKTLHMTKSCCENLLLISKDEILFLSTNGEKLRKIELPHPTWNAIQLNVERFLCYGEDHTVYVIDDKGIALEQTVLEKEDKEKKNTELMTSSCMANDNYGNIYIVLNDNNNRSMVVVYQAGVLQCVEKFKENIIKICLDELKKKLYVLTCSANVLEYNIIYKEQPS